MRLKTVEDLKAVLYTNGFKPSPLTKLKEALSIPQESFISTEHSMLVRVKKSKGEVYIQQGNNKQTFTGRNCYDEAVAYLTTQKIEFKRV